VVDWYTQTGAQRSVSDSLCHSTAARQIHGKVLVIWWTIFGFVAIGFEHCVANMFFIPTGIFLGSLASFL
jgi:formate/nitrite transporter FocA (FNT family)